MLSLSLLKNSFRMYFSLLKDLIRITPLQVSSMTLSTFPEFTEFNLFTSLFAILNSFCTMKIIHRAVSTNISK